ncbi:hypothetical protein CDAR_165221 [Caerostris darwini]|uniref:Uncharacterized protein n=1 Tax=Caerostris darwini TaxID=1538125 RepID=A0AAV4NYE1_9ARAC|nr:hypothetical protein CDAR_165221 [Caerostris darwini]
MVELRTNADSKNLKCLSGNKRWKRLAKGGRVPTHLEHAKAIQQTGHDYLQAHLHSIGLASDGICPFRLSSCPDRQYGRRSPAGTALNLSMALRILQKFTGSRMAEQSQKGVEQPLDFENFHVGFAPGKYDLPNRDAWPLPYSFAGSS